MDTQKKNITLKEWILSDKQYLELKARQNVIAGWVKEIAEKTKVKINFEDLEKAA